MAGTLLIIGGKEEKKTDPIILREITQFVQQHGGHLLVIPSASRESYDVGCEYCGLFNQLGIAHAEMLDLHYREEATHPANVAKFEGAAGVFLTGGDQVKLANLLIDTPVFHAMQALYARGGLIAGTSAGAAAMSELMLFGVGLHTNGLDTMHLTQGLNFLRATVIDSHFAQRGRISRLLNAVTLSPHTLGIGIDENTAIMVMGDETFHVIGASAVYVVDGMDVTFSNLSQDTLDQVTSIFNVKIHVLGAGYSFDLKTRTPIIPDKFSPTLPIL